MTRPDCVVMCNLINIHTYIHTYIHTVVRRREGLCDRYLTLPVGRQVPVRAERLSWREIHRSSPLRRKPKNRSSCNHPPSPLSCTQAMSACPPILPAAHEPLFICFVPVSVWEKARGGGGGEGGCNVSKRKNHKSWIESMKISRGNRGGDKMTILIGCSVCNEGIPWPVPS